MQHRYSLQSHAGHRLKQGSSAVPRAAHRFADSGGTLSIRTFFRTKQNDVMSVRCVCTLLMQLEILDSVCRQYDSHFLCGATGVVASSCGSTDPAGEHSDAIVPLLLRKMLLNSFLNANRVGTRLCDAASRTWSCKPGTVISPVQTSRWTCLHACTRCTWNERSSWYGFIDASIETLQAACLYFFLLSSDCQILQQMNAEAISS